MSHKDMNSGRINYVVVAGHQDTHSRTSLVVPLFETPGPSGDLRMTGGFAVISQKPDAPTYDPDALIWDWFHCGDNYTAALTKYQECVEERS